MRRGLGLAALLVLLGALVWSGRAFLSGRGSPAEAAAPRGASPVAAAPRASGARPAALDEPDRSREAGSGEPESSAARSEVAAPAPSAGLENELRSLLVLDTDGTPAVGARVLYTALDEQAVYRKHPSWDLELCDAWFEEHGLETRTDAEGVARLALPAGSDCTVAAALPGRWGRLHLRARRTSEARLQLRLDTTLDVRTVDSAGAPLAGIPVALRSRSGWWSNDQAERTSDATGRVLYAHVGVHLQLDERDWSVVVPGLLGEGSEVALDPEQLPDDPLVLVVPPFGRVEVKLASLPGAPPPGEIEVHLREDDGRGDDTPSFWSRPDSVSATARDGLAVFPVVSLGKQLVIEAGGDGAQKPTRERIDGPRVSAQVVRATLTLGADHTVLKLRVLDAAGAVLARRTIDTAFATSSEGRGTSRDTRSLTSDASGHIFFDLDSNWHAGLERTLDLRVPATEGQLGGHARLDLAREFAVGLHDLGDVQLRASAPLVAGRVIDALGKPVKDASVRVEEVHEYGEGQRYFQDIEVNASSDAGGEFALLGDSSSPLVRVTAEHDDNSSPSIECAPGSVGLVLELQSSGSVSGRLLLDQGVDSDALKIRLRPATPEGQHDWRNGASADLAADGAFTARGLRPGSYDLEVRSDSGGHTLAEVPAIEVPSGAPSADPRLAAIDLRGRLTSIQLDLVPPAGLERVMGTLTMTPVGALDPDAEPEMVFLQGREVKLVLAARAADLAIHVQGCRTVELRGVREDVRVQLEGGLQVRVRIPRDTPLPEPPRYIKVFLARESSQAFSFGHFQEQVFGAERELELVAGEAGRLQVNWLWEERSESSLTTSSIDPAEPQWLEILDVPGEQVFDLEVPAEVLEYVKGQ